MTHTRLAKRLTVMADTVSTIVVEGLGHTRGGEPGTL